MTPSRRDVLTHLSALFAMPLLRSLSFTDLAGADDPLAGTALTYQAGRVRGDYTAAELVRVALDRAASHGRALRAIDQLADSALAEAQASDARLRAGALLGPLDGAPVFAKSIYDMRGLPTTASSAEWAALFPHAATRDALEVQRLRAAGAVVLGKTAADDFAYRGNGTSSLTGQVRNPYDASGVATPGGSSAGAAVVVACHMAFAALGTDDGGSNRIPAQFTGVVGMKPTFGLVPRTGVLPTWPYLDTHGPLARTVLDAALMLDAIAGPDSSDALAHTAPWEREQLTSLRDDALRGVRLGVVALHAPRAQMSAAGLALYDRALADCEQAGANLEQIELPVTRVNVQARFAEAARARGDVMPNPKAAAPTANALRRYFEGQGVEGDVTDAVRRGLAAFRAFYDVIPSEWEAARPLLSQPYEDDATSRSFAQSREDVVRELAAFMQARRLDALVYPTMPFPAPAATDPWPDVRTPLGYGNWLGLPEVSVPTGYLADGLPGGNLSFVGLPRRDAQLLALAHAYEQQSRRFAPPPLPW
jgi:Asp-tRNA(Asn)/Glu-tRNA(Gln) amidotransferase A subunit family amidase